MKKIYFILSLLTAGMPVFAQTFPNAGMETWRSNATGTAPAVTVHAPISWYGFDSLAIASIESFNSYVHADTGHFHAQLFQESSIVHSGSFSAKIMTLKQSDTLGLVSGSLTNAVANINFTALVPLLLAGGPVTGATIAGVTTFTGGTPVTQRITSVSAWVEYKPGVDTNGHPGLDTGLLTVQALGHWHGGTTDTVVGTASLKILPSAAFTQVTANIRYSDSTNYYIDNVRIIFSSSSGGVSRPCDSSTLYVDDVTMTGVPNPDFTAVPAVTAGNAVKVYPNPASDVLYVESMPQATGDIVLYSVSGEKAAQRKISGNATLDVSSLPAGIYTYMIHDPNGSVIQRGKVAVSR